MPGCGKSTVGTMLAARLERPFLDLDDLIVKAVKKPISAIFEEIGENGFRELETKILKESFAQQNGCVIALGGGTVLREENVDTLRRNGRLYWLDRPIEDLIPTKDRPLASDWKALEKRYAERYDRYREVADCRIAVRGNAESVADDVGKEFER